MLTKKQIAAICKVDAGNYACLCSDIADISDAVGGGPIATGIDCFNYGFLKGQRAERAAAKKKARREMEKHAPGYGLLMTLVEKNMSNERFIQSMTAFALGFTGDSSKSSGKAVAV